MIVLVDGLGTIGVPLAQFLLRPQVRDTLGIKEIIIRKFSPTLKNVGMLYRFHKAGAKLAVAEKDSEEFIKILRSAPSPFRPDYTYSEALGMAGIVLDCTKDGSGLKNKKDTYQHLPADILFIGQGSETNFGLPYAYGHNDEVLEKNLWSLNYVWIMSCNTHAVLAILHTVSLGYTDLTNIARIRFSFDRRGADVVNEKTNTTPEVGQPSEPYGTHQIDDAIQLLKTLDAKNASELNIYGTADKDPQPFMHKIEVSLDLRQPITPRELQTMFIQNPLTGITYHNHIGGVYTEGKDWGPTGRIIVQTILVHDSVSAPRPNELTFKCFTPQDGNPLLSSLAVVAQKLDPSGWREKIKILFHPHLERFRIV